MNILFEYEHIYMLWTIFCHFYTKCTFYAKEVLSKKEVYHHGQVGAIHGIYFEKVDLNIFYYSQD